MKSDNYSDKEVKQLNRFKKIIAFIMLFVLILSFSTEVLYALPVEDKENSTETIQTEVYNSEYEKYKSQNNSEKATEEIELMVEGGNAFKLTKGNTVDLAVDIPKNGAYNIALSFAPLDEITEDYKFSLKIDGVSPFSDCEELVLRALWEDEGETRTLTNGDQVSPLQKHKDGFYLQKITDEEGIEIYPYEFMLSEGNHTISIENTGKDFLLEKICLLPPEITQTYSEVSKNYKNYKNYDGEQIVIEAEKAAYKNDYSLSSKSDQGTADISPSSASNAVINHIGGTTWNSTGSEIVWKVDVPKDGLYKLGIAFKQSYVTDGEVTLIVG